MIFSIGLNVSPDPGETAMDAEIRIRQKLDLFRQKVLAKARQNAPGQMGRHINSTPVVMTEPGVLKFTIRFPRRYRSVELGSGVYVGGTAIYIEPKRRKALRFADGNFAANATVLGQKAQRPVTRAFQEHLPDLGKEVLVDIL
jgi:hypothetical protein